MYSNSKINCRKAIAAVCSFLIVFHLGKIEILFGQTQFQYAIGGSGLDIAYSIIQTTDGGYATAGASSSFGNGLYDMYIIKLDASGTLQWSKSVGGAELDFAHSIIQTTDGGYAAAGMTQVAGLYDMCIVKFDDAGTLQWSRAVGGDTMDYAFSIIQTNDGGYALAGYTYSFGVDSSDIYVVKLDSNGMLQWSRTVGGPDEERAYSIIQTTDGGYAIAGWVWLFKQLEYDIYIVKIDSSGMLQWTRTVSGTLGYSIKQTTDGGYTVGGQTYFYGAGGSDVYIVKLDSSGTFQWGKTVGGTNDEFALSIVQTNDGGYAAAGIMYFLATNNYDMYITKLDPGGMLEWSRAVGATNDDRAYSIIQTADGSYVVAGFGFGDMYIVKLDRSGSTCGNVSSPPSSSGSGGTIASLTPTVTSPPSRVTSPSFSVTTGTTVTTICLVGVEPISNRIPNSFKLYQNYPNPFNQLSVINYQLPIASDVRLRVYDMLGREVASLVDEKQSAGSYAIRFDASQLSSGVYLYRLIADDNIIDTKKLILLK